MSYIERRILGAEDILPSVLSSGTMTSLDKLMAALTTVFDGDQGVATGISKTPSGEVEVEVGGNSVPVGDGVLTEASYFSGDGGASARAMADIVAGDTWHWNGATIAGFQLNAATDKVDFDYEAA